MQEIKRNVDEKDLKHLGSFSTHWWDLNGPFKPLHIMNQIRVPFICEGLIRTGMINSSNKDDPDVLKGLNILDVGSGAGILSEALAKLKANVTDQSLNIEYISELIEEHSISNAGKYDAIVASEVIEHVPDQRAFLDGMVKCLKPNGSIFITTPNRTLVSLLLAKVISEYVINIIPKGTHDWRQFIRPSEVKEILKEMNCDVVLNRGFCYNPFNGSFKFLKYNGVSYALHAVKNVTETQL